MKCPRCVQVIHRGADLCPHCGFGMTEAVARYGAGSEVLRRMSDGAGLMKSRERMRVEEALDAFARRFPQLFLAVRTMSGQADGQLRQFGFWLLNRARFEDVAGKGNDAGILLVIDARSKSAALTWGYRLDPYLSEEDSFLCLSRAHSYWIDGNFADGILRLVEQLGLILAKRSAQARRDPGRFERRMAPPSAIGQPGRRNREVAE